MSLQRIYMRSVVSIRVKKMARKYNQSGPMSLDASPSEAFPSGTKKVMLGDVPTKDLFLDSSVGTLEGVDKQIRNSLAAINKNVKGN